MTTNQEQYNLSDEAIVEIAHAVDKMIVECGEKYKPNGIQMAAIALGRLMVFTKHVGCFDSFCDMMAEINKMKEAEPLVKTEDLNQ
jgi:hypothetical protein